MAIKLNTIWRLQCEDCDWAWITTDEVGARWEAKEHQIAHNNSDGAADG